MKTQVHLWDELCTFENLYLAWLETCRGKSTKRQAVHFECQLEENLCTLLDELQFSRVAGPKARLGPARLQYETVGSMGVIANGPQFVLEWWLWKPVLWISNFPSLRRPKFSESEMPSESRIR